MKLTINHTTISYHIYGEGKTIYFLHGLGLDYQSMLNFYEPLFKKHQQFRRVYIDLPGMGDSLANQSLRSSDDIVNCIQQFIEFDSKDEPISLIGHSYGGYLALGLAYLLTNKVNTLFLTCPVTVANTKNRNKDIPHSIIKEQIIPSENQAFFEEFLTMNTVIDSTTWQMYQQLIIPGLLKFNHSFWQDIQTENYAFSFENKLASLATTLNGIILLGKHDAVVGHQDQETLFNQFPSIDTITLENAGHNLPIDSFKQVQLFFEAFLLTI